MGRLLDNPTRASAAELAQRARLDPHAAWPEPPCHTPRAASRCSASVAVLITGEFRDFVPPWRQGLEKSLTAVGVLSRLYDALVPPNGPADLFVHSWDSALARSLMAALPVPPCASVCERYGKPFFERLLARHTGFRLIDGYLRLNHSKETPHIVDFFYKLCGAQASAAL